jgi:hypothetical protein
MLSQAGRAGKGGHRPSSTPWPAVAVAVLPPPTARPLCVTNVKPPKCRLCSGLHWNNETHVFATNTKSATNVATNNATNGPAGVSEGLGRVRPGNAGNVDGQQGAVGGGSPAALKTPNRRDREAYNAYQREYMKEWRKRKSPT